MKQRTLIELKELALVSKIHVAKLKNARVTLKVSEYADESKFQVVQFREKVVGGGKVRAIDVGNIPAKFIMIEVD